MFVEKTTSFYKFDNFQQKCEEIKHVKASLGRTLYYVQAFCSINGHKLEYTRILWRCFQIDFSRCCRNWSSKLNFEATMPSKLANNPGCRGKYGTSNYDIFSVIAKNANLFGINEINTIFPGINARLYTRFMRKVAFPGIHKHFLEHFVECIPVMKLKTCRITRNYATAGMYP